MPPAERPGAPLPRRSATKHADETHAPPPDASSPAGGIEPEALVRALREPDAWPGPPGRVGFLQTHISLLFFVGERVYKVKKPVDRGFLDYTTLERRRHFCEEEVRLNARLSPDMYLGVVPVVRGEDGRLAVVPADGTDAGAEGEVVEWAVEMLRLPEDRMLSALLEEGDLDDGRLDALVGLLVRFHAEARTGEGVDRHGEPDAVRYNALENFEQTERFLGDGPSDVRVLSRRAWRFLRARTERFLDGNAGLLRRRVAEGRIRDGHGDLHAGNVCFWNDRIWIYDCIEFNERFRCGDVAADLAFLTMDFDHRGHPGAADVLIERYARATGDADLPRLVGFYEGYRALVRCKVNAMAAEGEADDGARAAKAREAATYACLALGYELPPALVLLCGLPATGKSVLAAALARPLRARLLRSDVERRALSAAAGAGAPAGSSGDGGDGASGRGYGVGRYDERSKRAVYDRLLDLALGELAGGRCAVVDATFSRRAFRRPFLDAARAAGHPLYLVHVTAPEGVVRERLARRARDPDAVSEADAAVYEAEKRAFEAPDELPAGSVVEISGTGEPPLACAALLERRVEGETAP